MIGNGIVSSDSIPLTYMGIGRCFFKGRFCNIIGELTHRLRVR